MRLFLVFFFILLNLFYVYIYRVCLSVDAFFSYPFYKPLTVVAAFLIDIIKLLRLLFTY